MSHGKHPEKRPFRTRWATVREAAIRLDYSVETIQAWTKYHDIQTRNWHRGVEIYMPDVRAFMVRRKMR